MKSIQALFLLSIMFVSCETKEDYLLSKVPTDHSQIFFSNNIVENNQYNVFDYHNLYNGGGVAALDVNNDGLMDLFFSGNQVNDKLYLNKGNFVFEDISQRAGIESQGWSTGISITDINGDGLVDIYVCKAGNENTERRANKFFINQGNLTFKDEALERGLADTTHSSQAAFFDYDHDGDLDMYLLTTSNLIRNPNLLRKPGQYGDYALDKLYQNNGQGIFTAVGKAAGILNNTHGLGLAISDINNDGWEDILASSDFLPNDALYINNQDGTFSERGKEYFAYQSRFSMGNDIADFDNDGLMDIITTDMLPADNAQQKKMIMTSYHVFETEQNLGYHPQFTRNMLHRNLGNESNEKTHFSELGQFHDVHASDWSWAPLFYDLDNDGFKDLSITNGYLRDIIDADYVAYNLSFAERTESSEEMRQYMNDNALELPFLKKNNQFFRNTGEKFQNVSNGWLQNEESFSNGAIYADLDNDGDLDMVVNNINEPASILRNNSENHFLKINLNGNPQNLYGQGSKITVKIGDKTQTHFQSLSRGYLSSQSPDVIFGCENHEIIDELIITWSNGKTQKIIDLKSNQTITLNEIDAIKKVFEISPLDSTPPLFKEITIDFDHTENRYIDYYRENLLLHKYSEPGPCLTSGDINSDGLEDFFMAGSSEKSGTFFLQQKDGSFKMKQQWAFQKEEDSDCLFFDANGDSYLDLYLLAGSNEFPIGSENYQDRIYLNDGKGNFTNQTTLLLPEIRIPGSTIKAIDIDNDGDLDLFRGAAVLSGQFPMASESFLFLNENGIYKKLSIGYLGLVSDANVSDINNDGWMDLIVVGEFMAPRIFINEEGELKEQKELQNIRGLWNCIASGDLDNDGDIDLVLGNIGQNYRYKFSKEFPLRIYLNDINEDGLMDAIPAYFFDGEEYPIASRDDLIRQFPNLRAKFPNYTSYAEAKIGGVIDLENSEYIYADRMESIQLINDGSGNFEIKLLPKEVQNSPINAILIADFDEDNLLDILLAGNDNTLEPTNAGFVNASRGQLLFRKPNGEYFLESNSKTGIWLKEETKNLLFIKSKSSYIIAAQNNARLKIFKTIE